VKECLHPRGGAAPLFRARDWVTGDVFEVCRCAGCRLVVTLPQPTAEGMAAYYPAEYHGPPAGRRFPAPVEWLQGRLYGSRARRVEALAGGRAGRVLDLGCGPGRQLEAFRCRGWEVQGTELSESSAARARRLGIPVHVGPASSWPWPAGHFDAVVMWHTLEHWPDPRQVMDRVGRLLRSGGVLMVSVPNFGSVEARLAREKWFHLDVPRHLAHFTVGALVGELGAAGLEIRRVSFVAQEYDCFSFVQSALNRLGLEQNLLYDLLRSRGARLLRRRAGRLQVVAAVLLAAPLALAALPATALLALAGQGAVVTIHAVKPASE